MAWLSGPWYQGHWLEGNWFRPEGGPIGPGGPDGGGPGPGQGRWPRQVKRVRKDERELTEIEALAIAIGILELER